MSDHAGGPRGRSAAVLVVSDRASSGKRDDEVGPVLEEMLRRAGFDVSHFSVVPDDQPTIASLLETWARSDRLDLIVTTGGTGLGPRDVTPEAVASIADRMIDGLAELMRQKGFSKTPLAALSRQIAAQAGRTLILALPGSPNGAVESFEAVIPVLPHALDMIAGAESPHPMSAGAESPLPPRESPAAPVVISGLRTEPIEPASLGDAIRNPRSGGVVCFEGVARSPEGGRVVDHLYYEAHEDMAARKLEEIASEAVRAHGLQGAVAVHRTGIIRPGEVIVVAAAAAPHRNEAFEAAREIIERIKSETAIWKKEVYEDGGRWVGSEKLLA